MTLDVHYYGMIAEATSCTQEFLELESPCTVETLNTILRNKHQQLSTLSYKIAVDQHFVKSKTLLESKNEIALLPPFSGG